jgi:RNA polymerase sigma-70 factor (ECF subfamily)
MAYRFDTVLNRSSPLAGRRGPTDVPGVSGQRPAGLVAQQDGITLTVYAFDIAGDRITRIWAVRNPDKLRLWTTT